MTLEDDGDPQLDDVPIHVIEDTGDRPMIGDELPPELF